MVRLRFAENDLLSAYYGLRKYSISAIAFIAESCRMFPDAVSAVQGLTFQFRVDT